MTQSERFAIIERMRLTRRSVAFAEIKERLGVSRASLFRDLRDLRERMNVPIVRDRDSGCYRIDRSVERYELPGVWFSAGEIHALLSMQQLLAAFDTGGILAEHISPLRDRLARMLKTVSPASEDIARRIHILSAAARPCAPQQEGVFLEDGSYQLRVPYSNDPELIMDILKYGPECEVVGPGELREKVKMLLETAAQRYGND